MKIACVQMDIAFGNPERNFEAIETYIEEAANAKADVVVLPEMWNAGYALDKLDVLADKDGSRTKELFSRLAGAYEVNIVGGSVATKKRDGFYNTMYVASRTGEIVTEYDKAHLFKLMAEHHFLNAGQKMNIFELDGVTCGGIICYDLRFPEWIRAHTLHGAHIMFIPAEWPAARIDHWQLLLQARAIENQCFVVGVNRTGDDPNNKFNGHTMVVAPWGEVLLSKQTGEGIFYAELDLKQVEAVRKMIPVFQDRRTDLY
ncbi:hydrolase [Mesobacillus campisalis]|uniref:Hydrolase n=1 Tax=Mesobacillus campisalis TaxID=1408103 RepID=A0A0M2T134_9BACI|nr:carbon-nitrogen family hydrolase [Mesobacillus campisalis]KKK38535.1 hydrolase [Mesobacillus campisalis]